MVEIKFTVTNDQKSFKIISNDLKMIQDQIKPQKIVKNIENVDFEY